MSQFFLLFFGATYCLKLARCASRLKFAFTNGFPESTRTRRLCNRLSCTGKTWSWLWERSSNLKSVQFVKIPDGNGFSTVDLIWLCESCNTFDTATPIKREDGIVSSNGSMHGTTSQGVYSNNYTDNYP